MSSVCACVTITVGCLGNKDNTLKEKIMTGGIEEPHNVICSSKDENTFLVCGKLTHFVSNWKAAQQLGQSHNFRRYYHVKSQLYVICMFHIFISHLLAT